MRYSGTGIQFNIGVAQNLVPLLLTAPEQGLNTGNQLFRRKWFDQIVIRARF